MKNTIAKHCSFDFSKSNWFFGNALNPFCDDKQLKEDGTQVRHRRHHWHRDDDIQRPDDQTSQQVMMKKDQLMMKKDDVYPGRD